MNLSETGYAKIESSKSKIKNYRKIVITCSDFI